MEAIGSVLKSSKPKELDLQSNSNNIPICPKCGEPLGKVVNMFFGTRIYPRMCECRRKEIKLKEIKEKNREKQIRLERIIKNSLMNEKFRRCTFENWNPNLGNEKLFKIALNYSENFEKMRKENQGILLYGDPGNGKTYVTACIANKLLDKMVPVICVGSIALMERISESKSNWGDEGIFTVLNNLENADLLIIDDLGTEPDNKWTRAMMYQVIEKRCSIELPTIITTNIGIKDLKERYDERTYSRLSEMCSFIRNTGNDIRKFKGKDKTERFLSELL